MRALRIVARRALAALPTVLIVTLGAYLLVESAPGDAADAYLAQTGGDAGFAAELREPFGLAGSTPERLMRFYAGRLHGDLGASAVFGRPVVAVILERLPTTLLLMGCAAAFTAGIGTLLGLAAGARPGSWRDHAVTLGTLALPSMPNFWLALLLILTFGVRLARLPRGRAALRTAPSCGAPSHARPCRRSSFSWASRPALCSGAAS